jgi:hypothetical protein
MTPAMLRPLPLLVLVTALLAGCDLLGIEPASAVAAQKEAEGKAIGAACRQAARAMEDCFALHRKADKAAIYAGWREMSDYMRENKMEPVTAQVTASADAAGRTSESEGSAPPSRTGMDRARGADVPARAGSGSEQGEKPSRKTGA